MSLPSHSHFSAPPSLPASTSAADRRGYHCRSGGGGCGIWKFLRQLVRGDWLHPRAKVLSVASFFGVKAGLALFEMRPRRRRASSRATPIASHGHKVSIPLTNLSMCDKCLSGGLNNAHLLSRWVRLVLRVCCCCCFCCGRRANNVAIAKPFLAAAQVKTATQKVRAALLRNVNNNNKSSARSQQTIRSKLNKRTDARMVPL